MKRVLVADGSLHQRSAMRLLLEQAHSVASVEEAATPDACLDLLARSTVDLLLLDWQLCAGQRDLLHRLRSAYPGISIVVLSSRPEDSRAALAAGAHAFVSKMEAPDALLIAVLGADAGVQPP